MVQTLNECNMYAWNVHTYITYKLYNVHASHVTTVQLRCNFTLMSSVVPLKCEYLTLKHVIERLTSNACECTKGPFLVITILDNQRLSVILCLLS